MAMALPFVSFPPPQVLATTMATTLYSGLLYDVTGKKPNNTPVKSYTGAPALGIGKLSMLLCVPLLLSL